MSPFANHLPGGENACDEIKENHLIYAQEIDPCESETAIVDRITSPGKWASDSYLFDIAYTDTCVTSVRYATHRYLNALNSYSPYLKLESTAKGKFFKVLTSHINKEHSGVIEFKLVSGFQVARKS